MANDFYVPTTNPATRAVASSALMRAEFSALEGAFDKLPDHYGGATQGFSGGSWDSAAIDNAIITDSSVNNSPVIGSHYLSLSTTATNASPTAAAGSTQALFFYAVNTGNFSGGIGYGPAAAHYCLFDKYNNVVFGNGSTALSTTATDNFLMIPTCAGTPTGTPAHTYGSSVPLVYDSTNNMLYVYDGSWLGTGALT